MINIKCIKQAKVKTENMTPIGLESTRPFKSHAQSSIEAEAVAETVYNKNRMAIKPHVITLVSLVSLNGGTNHDGS